MTSIGVIAEYNPFHNGHLYHINKIKEMYPDSLIVLVMSSSFTERGIPSIINKWDKTKIALNNKIDLVVELPYMFSTQSADIFARESIRILKELKVEKLIFGSENNNIDMLTHVANIQINNNEYDNLVKEYLDSGINYPTAMNKALIELGGYEVNESNDLLGLSYIKEIIRQDANIEPISIKRTNDYLETSLTGNISSATAIRKAFIENNNISNTVSKEVLDILNKEYFIMDDYFELLKYKIYSDNDLSKYLDVDEGIENRILSVIDKVNNYDELVESVKTKRYTYNKINRMFCHILCGFTKELRDKYENGNYIRVLGFNNNGKEYLNKIKKDTNVPIITKYIKNNEILDFEKKVTSIYVSKLNINRQKELIEKEYRDSLIRIN